MALLAGMARAAASDEEFLLNVPGINGGVTEQGYLGWISITSFAESFVGSAAGRAGAGGSAGRTSCEDLHLTKILDSTSPELTMAVATGHVYNKIILVARRVSVDQPLEFLRFTLTNTVISSIAFAGDSSVSARTETLVLRPRRIEVQYTPQNPDGGAGATVSAFVDCSSTFL
jgi:type VI secretion system secreted protein Hcp